MWLPVFCFLLVMMLSKEDCFKNIYFFKTAGQWHAGAISMTTNPNSFVAVIILVTQQSVFKWSCYKQQHLMDPPSKWNIFKSQKCEHCINFFVRGMGNKERRNKWQAFNDPTVNDINGDLALFCNLCKY